jgi:hypothetical protein
MTHNHLLWAGEEKNTLSRKTNVMLMVANPIHFGPLLGINCPSLTFQSPLTPLSPLWPILYYNDDINNFGLLDPEHYPFLKIKRQQE